MFSLFLSVFTAGHLWEKLFVWMPADARSIAVVCGMVGIATLAYALYTHRAHAKKWLIATLLFAVTTVVGVSPWLIKNGSESQFFHTHSIDGILNGS